jgi:hypothetical protein
VKGVVEMISILELLDCNLRFFFLIDVSICNLKLDAKNKTIPKISREKLRYRHPIRLQEPSLRKFVGDSTDTLHQKEPFLMWASSSPTSRKHIDDRRTYASFSLVEEHSAF